MVSREKTILLLPDLPRGTTGAKKCWPSEYADADGTPLSAEGLASASLRLALENEAKGMGYCVEQFPFLADYKIVFTDKSGRVVPEDGVRFCVR